jgi:hypothetical protein
VDIEIELAFKVVRTELSKTVEVVRLGFNRTKREPTYWASSQVTIGERPIFHMRVKKARAVKISGAHMNS